jgi:DNA-binding NtrC family response regulator
VKISILVVDDEKNQRESLAGYLRNLNYDVSTENSAQTALAYLYKHPTNIVLTDFKMPYMSGADLLAEIQSRHPKTVVVIMTAYGTIDIAVDAMKNGAYDFLSKPVDLDALEHMLKDITLFLKKDTAKLKSSSLDDEVISRDEKMAKLFQQALKIASTQASVLISGETGTGKEVLAEYVHRHSKRSDKKMITVNCAALPPNLIESELFGHAKGSFTGATEDRKGRFEDAHEGTLFLDEIGDLPLDIQVKLLRFLQSGEFQKVGSNTALKSNVRVIAATNVDLQNAVAMGNFRQDLFYRLNVIQLEIPALRVRKDDILPLTEYFIRKIALRESLPLAVLDASAKEALLSYGFPGNVRELGNVIERATLLCSASTIEKGDLYFQQEMSVSTDPTDLKGNVRQLERDLIITTLADSNGNQSECARRLGVSERVLRYKLQKFGLK